MRMPRVRRVDVVGIAVVFAIALMAAACGYSGPTTVASDGVGAAPGQGATAGQAVFEQKCDACHTIGGGPLVGPDLAGTTDARDAEWLHAWITDPASLAEVDEDTQRSSPGECRPSDCPPAKWTM